MLLKNLMEDKQLDFNQPLLSVRRFSSTLPASEVEGKRKTDDSLPKIPPLPVYKSELKSGPVRNPGTVPFIWEQAPVRPKDESNSQAKALVQPSIAPKLPPGRILDVKEQALDRGSEVKAVTCSEHGNVHSNSQNVSSVDKNVNKYESSRKRMEDTGSSGSDDDEAYVDALDTLSRTESFFLNCSLTGVSGLDGPDLKPSGIFSADPQTRDLMMGRFLPAAKAMASETPPHAIRKQPKVQERPRHVKKEVGGNKQHSLYQYSPNNFSPYAQDKTWEESEDEDDCNGHEKSSAGICGLFPQLCLKSSFCLLNPVPGMRMHGRKQASSVRTLHTKSLNAGSFGETRSKHAKSAACEQRLPGGHRRMEHHADRTKPKWEPNQITCDSHKLNGPPLYRLLQNNEISSQNVLLLSDVHEKSNPSFPEKLKDFEVKGVDSRAEGRKNIRDLLSGEENKWESGSGSPVVEKTLYIDSVHNVNSANTNSADTKEVTDYQGADFKSHLKSMGIEETPSVLSSLLEAKHLDIVDEKAVSLQRSSEPLDSSSQSPPERLTCGMQTDAYGYGQHLIQDCIKLRSPKMVEKGKINLESQRTVKQCSQESSDCLSQDPITLARSKESDNKKIAFQSQLHMKSSNQESPHGNYTQLPLPLPSPKSPSESWLKRTLPTVSTRNSSSCSSLGTNNYIRAQASKTPSVDPKWEIIVKSSNVEHGRLRYSTEQLDPIPES